MIGVQPGQPAHGLVCSSICGSPVVSPLRVWRKGVAQAAGLRAGRRGKLATCPTGGRDKAATTPFARPTRSAALSRPYNGPLQFVIRNGFVA